MNPDGQEHEDPGGPEPTSKKFDAHAHVKFCGVSVHTALMWQLWVPTLHSLMSRHAEAAPTPVTAWPVGHKHVVPEPVKPDGHEQAKLPGVSVHTALMWQLWVPTLHSFMLAQDSFPPMPDDLEYPKGQVQTV